MMGEEEYIKSIRETVSDNVASVKSRTDETPARWPWINAARASETARGKKCLKRSSCRIRKWGCLNALGILFKILFFAFAGIFALTMIGIVIAFLVAGTSFIPLKSLFIDHGYENSLMWLSAGLLFAVP